MCLVAQPVGNAKAKSILFDSAEKAASMGGGCCRPDEEKYN